jgi:hypothetical protein
MLGAGSEGIDVADGLRQATKEEGLSEEEARSRFSVGDKTVCYIQVETTSPRSRRSMI